MTSPLQTIQTIPLDQPQHPSTLLPSSSSNSNLNSTTSLTNHTYYFNASASTSTTSSSSSSSSSYYNAYTLPSSSTPPPSHCYTNNRGKKYMMNNFDHPYQIIPRPLIYCPTHSTSTKSLTIPFKGQVTSNVKIYSDTIPIKERIHFLTSDSNGSYSTGSEFNTKSSTTITTATSTTVTSTSSTTHHPSKPVSTTTSSSSSSSSSYSEIPLADLLQPPATLNDVAHRKELSSILKPFKFSALSSTFTDIIQSEQTLNNITAQFIRALQRDDPQLLHINFGPLEKQVKDAAFALYGATSELIHQFDQARQGLATLMQQQKHLWRVIQSSARTSSSSIRSSTLHSRSSTSSTPSLSSSNESLA